MASIKVSELPSIAAITPNDVLIINDENSTTSSINITNFTSSFTGQSLSFTGTTSFGDVTIRGNSTIGSGQIVLNCEQNSHGVKVKGPAHSAAANYTFILPVSMGDNGQVLTTNGTNQTSWVTITPATISAATAAQGTKADSAMQVNGTNTIPAYADDAAAANGGVVVGGFYRIGNAVQVRLT